MSTQSSCVDAHKLAGAATPLLKRGQLRPSQITLLCHSYDLELKNPSNKKLPVESVPLESVRHVAGRGTVLSYAGRALALNLSVTIAWPTSLSPQQLRDLETTERVASVFSLIGTTFILFTFIYSPDFRKPVNRLIFYASWGNTMCNIATLISQAGIRAGRNSALCQFQGFLIQMFLPADALWNLAMALNVYLTIFKKYNTEQLKSLEWKYVSRGLHFAMDGAGEQHLLCYGYPFIVAVIYLFISTPSRGRIYGPATLWCWIDIKWVFLRIALVYAEAWICIIASFFIYLFAGKEIFNKRRQLRRFKAPPGQLATIENPFTDFKTTQIQITHEPVNRPYRYSSSIKAPNAEDKSYYVRSPTPAMSKSFDAYSVTVDTAPTEVQREVIAIPPQTSKAMQQRNNRAALEANTAAWGYTKVAILFFISLLVTWVPSSVNRVYSLIHPDLVTLPFVRASGVVLPLMGFWNAVIYTVTSWSAVSDLFRGKLQRPSWRRRPSRPRMQSPFSRSTNRFERRSPSDSARGLAGDSLQDV